MPKATVKNDPLSCLHRCSRPEPPRDRNESGRNGVVTHLRPSPPRSLQETGAARSLRARQRSCSSVIFTSIASENPMPQSVLQRRRGGQCETSKPSMWCVSLAIKGNVNAKMFVSKHILRVHRVREIANTLRAIFGLLSRSSGLACRPPPLPPRIGPLPARGGGSLALRRRPCRTPKPGSAPPAWRGHRRGQRRGVAIHHRNTAR